MASFVKHIPNGITALNAFFGSLASVSIFEGQWDRAGLFFVLALLADFLDGMVARLLHASGPMGKELDSLADMVSFGFFPGTVAYYLLSELTHGSDWAYFGFVITCFSALRLAKFNLDTRQTVDFIGLATPANSIFFFGLALLYSRFEGFRQILDTSPWILFVVIIVFSLLLVSEIPMFSLKFKNFSVRENVFRYLLLAGGIALFFISPWALPAGVIIWYLVLAFAKNLLKID